MSKNHWGWESVTVAGIFYGPPVDHILLILQRQSIPSEQHVGDVFYATDSTKVKPVTQWNLKQPDSLAIVRNQYDRGQVSLCGLFSKTVKVQACASTVTYKEK